jgi:hypothetical protein
MGFPALNANPNNLCFIPGAAYVLINDIASDIGVRTAQTMNLNREGQ